MHVHAHAGTRVHEATSLTGLVPERVQLTVHTTEPTGTVPEPFHCDHIARWSARTGTSGRSGTGLNTGNWNGSGTVLVSNLWCEHGLIGCTHWVYRCLYHRSTSFTNNASRHCNETTICPRYNAPCYNAALVIMCLMIGPEIWLPWCKIIATSLDLYIDNYHSNLIRL